MYIQIIINEHMEREKNTHMNLTIESENSSKLQIFESLGQTAWYFYRL